MGAAAAEADRTLFVGNLDPKVTEELIFELFHQAGPVIKVKIPKDRDGRPKQFAFVNFKHEESVPYGLSLLNGIKLYGRPIKIQFRSGSSHASHEGNPSCSPHGAASTSPSGAPHPAANCSRYESHTRYDRSPDSMGAAGFSSAQRSLPSAENLQRQAVMKSAGWQQPPFPLPGYPPHAFHPAPQMPRRPELPRKGRPSAHPYHPDGRHFGRERFGERGHEGEHHYRGGREEPPYADRHRDGWSHDYDYRREGYRDTKWPPSRH
ncbi:PREDICTED: RNA-binding protein 7 isoform X1 [Calidris pugnax]|uniref:RNA-binding protein 7 isoform X1 n=1 Tax=Calidris pugnax TaxID=198806 RepID=UPI00071CFB72|nr:PREDICTED: RNA-binding protein 7 isoform X1 [Calidris pugnax]